MWGLDTELPEGRTLDELETVLQRHRRPPAVAGLLALRRGLGWVLRLDAGSDGFVSVYADRDERLYRIENRTVTAFLHVALVDRRPRIGVYVRPHGPLGRAYLALIEPFRRLVVYPGLVRAAGRASASLTARASAGSTGPGA